MKSLRWAALAAVVAVVASGMLATAGVQWGEIAVVELLNGLPGPIISVLRVTMQLGNRAAIVLVAVVAAVLADRRRVQVAAAVLIAGGVAWAASTVAKDVVERPRPAAFGAEVVRHEGAGGFGWPSTHTAVATGSLVGAALALRSRPGAAIAVGAEVGVARMAMGVHLPLDVVGGVGIGVLAAAAAVAVIKP